MARNATESIRFIRTQADTALTDWSLALSKVYISVPADIYKFRPLAGSDSMSYTKLGYPAPATFAPKVII